MNRSILLIIGLLILSFLGMLAGFYFFYPQINEERYAEITSVVPEEESTSEAMSMVGTPYLRTYDDITNQIEHLLNEQMTLQSTVDSLNNLEKELTVRLAEMQDELNSQNVQDGSAVSEDVSQADMNEISNQAGPLAEQQPQNLYAAAETVQQEEEEEAFPDRVKSLLNLDEEELAPILSKLNNDQLTRLYRNAGNIQREKVLRSLNPDRAARLMESIML